MKNTNAQAREELAIQALESQDMTRSDAQALYDLDCTRKIQVLPNCEMRKDCKNPVSYLDERGFIYCETHGKIRKASMKCRKLTPNELKQVQANERIKEY